MSTWQILMWIKFEYYLTLLALSKEVILFRTVIQFFSCLHTQNYEYMIFFRKKFWLGSKDEAHWSRSQHSTVTGMWLHLTNFALLETCLFALKYHLSERKKKTRWLNIDLTYSIFWHWFRFVWSKQWVLDIVLELPSSLVFFFGTCPSYLTCNMKLYSFWWGQFTFSWIDLFYHFF